MKKLISVGACFLIILAGFMFWIFKKGSAPETESETESTAETPPTASAASHNEGIPNTTAEGYTIKNYKGNIAVFEQGKSVPFRTTGIAVKELPPADRTLLEKGINASNQEELNLILEDYCS